MNSSLFDYILYYIVFVVFCGFFWTLCTRLGVYGGWPLYIVGTILYTNAWAAPPSPWFSKKQLTEEAPGE